MKFSLGTSSLIRGIWPMLVIFFTLSLFIVDFIGLVFGFFVSEKFFVIGWVSLSSVVKWKFGF